MQPIHEFGGNAYFKKRYDITGRNPTLARQLGNLTPGDGIRFHGRGYVQLTGRANYTQMGKQFSTDLVSSDAAADRVLQPALAAKIMFHGMEKGSFTGKKFADFFKGNTQDWVNARRIINRLDQAARIAQYAKDFYASISHTV
jgi:putative chitinase